MRNVEEDISLKSGLMNILRKHMVTRMPYRTSLPKVVARPHKTWLEVQTRLLNADGSDKTVSHDKIARGSDKAAKGCGKASQDMAGGPDKAADGSDKTTSQDSNVLLS